MRFINPYLLVNARNYYDNGSRPKIPLINLIRNTGVAAQGYWEDELTEEHLVEPEEPSDRLQTKEDRKLN